MIKINITTFQAVSYGYALRAAYQLRKYKPELFANGYIMHDIVNMAPHYVYLFMHRHWFM